MPLGQPLMEISIVAILLGHTGKSLKSAERLAPLDTIEDLLKPLKIPCNITVIPDTRVSGNGGGGRGFSQLWAPSHDLIYVYIYIYIRFDIHIYMYIRKPLGR